MENKGRKNEDGNDGKEESEELRESEDGKGGEDPGGLTHGRKQLVIFPGGTTCLTLLV